MYYAERAGAQPSTAQCPTNFNYMAPTTLNHNYHQHQQQATGAMIPGHQWNTHQQATAPYFSGYNNRMPADAELSNQNMCAMPCLTPCAPATNHSVPDNVNIPPKIKEEPPDWCGLQDSSPCSSSCALSGGDSVPSVPPDLTPTPPTPNTLSIKQEPAPPPAVIKQETHERNSPQKAAVKQEKITDSMQPKKKRDRFNGMSEDEVMKKTLPDHLREGLDIVIVGINPGLTAAYVGHHYAGPGNHFWKCLYLSGLIPEPMNAYDDYKLLDIGIGFTNIVERCSRGSADLTRKEIKDGGDILKEKIKKYKPKIAVFNGKGIYEIFCGHKNFYIGRQPEPLVGTDTAVFVMPSSSARCSQLPRAVDKVPFYIAVKKLRDYISGKLKDLTDAEVVFPDLELKVEPRKDRLEGAVKTEKGRKSTAKRKRKSTGVVEEGEKNYGGFTGMPTWPAMCEPPMDPPTQIPSMDTVFNSTPNLVKQENITELSNYGSFPMPAQFDPAFCNSQSGYQGNWAMGGGVMNGMPGPRMGVEQNMSYPVNNSLPAHPGGNMGCFPGGQPTGNFPAISYQNGQSYAISSYSSTDQNQSFPGTFGPDMCGPQYNSGGYPHSTS